jgi:O-antigen/teichoic acid export membrane protein
MTDAGAGASQAWARGWLSDSAQLLVSQALTILATSVAAIAIARTLDPSDWAVFSAFLGLSMALALVADFGIATWLLRELSSLLAEDGEAAAERSSRVVGSGLVVNAAMALPLLVGALVWSAAARPGAAVAAALLSLLAYGALTAGGNALEAVLRARRRVRLVLCVSLVEKTVLVTLLLAGVALGWGLVEIGVSYLAAGLARVAFDGIVVFGGGRIPLVRPAVRDVAGVARTSLPFALNAASLNLVPRLDTLVLLALSTTSAAWFAIGDRVLGPAFLIPGTLGAALYPFMATHAAKRTSPWVLAGAMGAVGVVVAGVGIALAPVLVPLLFGDVYEDAVPVVQVMLLSVPIVFTTSPLLVIAYSHRKERSLLVPMLGVSLVGTVAIVLGEAAGGAVFAGAGYVARFALFLVVVASVSFMAWREHASEALAGELSTSHRVSAQSP